MFWSLSRANSPQIYAELWHNTSEEGAAKPQLPLNLPRPKYTSSTRNPTSLKPPGRAGPLICKKTEASQVLILPLRLEKTAVGGYKCWLLFQRAHVLFAEPTLGGSQLPVTPFPGGPDTHFWPLQFLYICGIHSHRCTHVDKEKQNKSKQANKSTKSPLTHLTNQHTACVFLI